MEGCQNPDECHGLQHACLAGDHDKLMDLLSGPHIHHLSHLDTVGRSLAFIAVSCNSYTCLTVLLQYGVDANDQCMKLNGMTPLHLAAVDGRAKLIKLLLDYDADRSAKDSTGYRPIQLAQLNGHVECARVLEEYNSSAQELLTELQKLGNCNLSVCDRLWQLIDGVQRDKLINSSLEEGGTLLSRACEQSLPNLAQWLIDHYAKPDSDDGSPLSPLHFACKANSASNTQLLIQNFPELISRVSEKCCGGFHTLHYAVMFGNLELLKLVMEYNYGDSNTSFYATVDRRYCYRCAFNVNTLSLNCWTPLYCAVDCQKLDMVQYLLTFEVEGFPLVCSILDEFDEDMCNLDQYIEDESAPVRLHPVDAKSRTAHELLTPLQIAVKGGLWEIADLLIQHGADVDEGFSLMEDGDEVKWTPFTYALSKGDKPMMRLLLDNGCSDDIGCALEKCLRRRDDDLAIFLLLHKTCCSDLIRLQREKHAEMFSRSLVLNWSKVHFGDELKPDLIMRVAAAKVATYSIHSSDQSLSLNAITSIDISDCALTTLPVIVFQLPSLTHMKASGNSLGDLPPREFWKCESLKEIHLDKNSFIQIPKSLFTLPSLEKLSLARNRLKNLPSNMWKAPALQYLDLSRNGLDTLPGADINDVPVTRSLRKESTLTPVKTRKSAFYVLDDESSDQTNQAVTAWSKQQHNLEGAGEMASSRGACLQELNLSHNGFRHLPISLPCLAPSLRILNLRDNYMEVMGSASIYPISLIELDLTNNRIEKQMEGFEQHSDCCALLYLDNRMSNSTCTHRKSNFLNLSILKLSNNQLKSFEFVHQEEGRSVNETLFPKLELLDLSRNRLVSVSSDIANCTRLTQLDLSHNSIKEIPTKLSQLTNLWSINLTNCLIQGRLAALIESKARTHDILAYLRSILQKEIAYSYLRLMVVGARNAGKTHLLRALKTSKDQLRSNRANGVETGELSLNLSDKQCPNGPVKFRTWDLAGEETYRAVHQYFLSRRRSIFVVVWNLTGGSEDIDCVNWWLRTIKCICPGAPVILAGSHYDQLKPMKISGNSQTVRSRFVDVGDSETMGLPLISGFLEVSSTSMYNIRELSHLIYRAAWSLNAPGTSQQPLLRVMYPAMFVDLEKAIADVIAERKKQRMHSVLTREEYLKAISLRIKNIDMELVDQATQFLHENGILLHFTDLSLKDIFILDPLWLADLYAEIMALESSLGSAKGIIKTEDLSGILAKSSMCQPSGINNFIINLLSKFEVVVPFDDEHLLIPNHLAHKLETDVPTSLPKISHRNSTTRSRKVSHLVRRREVGNQLVDVPDSKIVCEPDGSIRRIYLMAYVPSGWWPRLISRIYTDTVLTELCNYYFDVSDEIRKQVQLSHSCAWKCWRHGILLVYRSKDLIRIQQKPQESYKIDLMLCEQGQKLAPLNVPMEENIVVEIEVLDYKLCWQGSPPSTSRSEVRGQVLNRIVEHFETLLEDWFPELGSSNSVGCLEKALVQRLVPCPHCVNQKGTEHLSAINSITNKQSLSPVGCFRLEDVVLNVVSGTPARCLHHGRLLMQSAAPDVVFYDLSCSLKFDDISGRFVIGQGSFGLVLSGHLRRQGTPRTEDVAVKIMTPWQDKTSSSTIRQWYLKEQPKWAMNPAQAALRAFSNARQEANMLSILKHDHINSLIGVSLRPLSLILERAPLGSLKSLLDQFAADSIKVHSSTVSAVLQQVADALSHMHSQRIVYRDLKTDNVLVWHFPTAGNNGSTTRVVVKLADLGISRALSGACGAKGFCGTPGYMAPEILEFRGQMSYTEKVDIYSFGIFIYELISLKRPESFREGCSSTTVSFRKPQLTATQWFAPMYLQELMSWCCEQQPSNRPAADIIVKVVNSPEFIQLNDVIVDWTESELKCCTVRTLPEQGQPPIKSEVLLMGACREGNTEMGIIEEFGFDAKGRFCLKETTKIPECTAIEMCCLVNDSIWLVDVKGKLLISHSPERTTTVDSASQIRGLVFCQSLNLVICLEFTGSILLYSASDHKCMGQLSLESEMGCFTLVNKSLWVGQKSISISIIGLSSLNLNNNVVNQSGSPCSGETHQWLTVCHPASDSTTSPSTELLVTDNQSVWSCLSPGSTIYRWDVGALDIKASYDFADIHFSNERITAIAPLHDNLVVGMTSGRILIIASLSMQLTASMAPHGCVPIIGFGILPNINSQTGCNIVTVAKGFRNLLAANGQDGAFPTKSSPSICILSWFSDNWGCMS